MDYIFNGQGHGDVAATLIQNKFDVGPLRPFFGEGDRPYVTMTVNGKPNQTVLALNTPTTLRKDEWKMLDDAVMETVYATPMRLFGDLRRRVPTVQIPNGMGKLVYEYQKMNDIGDATVSIDGVRESDTERVLFELTGLPLPIIHKDFQYTARQIEVSRNGGPSLDTIHARLATRKCLEIAEKFTVGLITETYDSKTIYGYTNFPQRMTQSITPPSSANHATTISELLSMKTKLTDAGFTGPFAVYFSNAWDLYLDEDYSTVKGTNTLRQRIRQIDGIGSVETSYWLPGNTVVMMQMSPDVAQAIIGMDPIVLQWPSKGGMMINFKVITILVPLLRADYNGVSGIVHGS